MQKKKTNKPLRHIKIVKSQRQRNNINGQQERKTVTYKGAPIKLSAYFSAETQHANSKWNDIIKILNDKKYQPRKYYPVKLSF